MQFGNRIGDLDHDLGRAPGIERVTTAHLRDRLRRQNWYASNKRLSASGTTSNSVMSDG